MLTRGRRKFQTFCILTQHTIQSRNILKKIELGMAYIFICGEVNRYLCKCALSVTDGYPAPR